MPHYLLCYDGWEGSLKTGEARFSEAKTQNPVFRLLGAVWKSNQSTAGVG